MIYEVFAEHSPGKTCRKVLRRDPVKRLRRTECEELLGKAKKNAGALACLSA